MSKLQLTKEPRNLPHLLAGEMHSNPAMRRILLALVQDFKQLGYRICWEMNHSKTLGQQVRDLEQSVKHDAPEMIAKLDEKIAAVTVSGLKLEGVFKLLRQASVSVLSLQDTKAYDLFYEQRYVIEDKAIQFCLAQDNPGMKIDTAQPAMQSIIEMVRERVDLERKLESDTVLLQLLVQIQQLKIPFDNVDQNWDRNIFTRDIGGIIQAAPARDAVMAWRIKLKPSICLIGSAHIKGIRLHLGADSTVFTFCGVGENAPQVMHQEDIYETLGIKILDCSQRGDTPEVWANLVRRSLWNYIAGDRTFSRKDYQSMQDNNSLLEPLSAVTSLPMFGFSVQAGVVRGGKMVDAVIKRPAAASGGFMTVPFAYTMLDRKGIPCEMSPDQTMLLVKGINLPFIKWRIAQAQEKSEARRREMELDMTEHLGDDGESVFSYQDKESGIEVMLRTAAAAAATPVNENVLPEVHIPTVVDNAVASMDGANNPVIVATPSEKEDTSIVAQNAVAQGGVLTEPSWQTGELRRRKPQQPENNVREEKTTQASQPENWRARTRRCGESCQIL